MRMECLRLDPVLCQQQTRLSPRGIDDTLPGMPKRVVPRDAAALVITRGGPQGSSVLLGQRHRGHAFMPDKFVFPGGRVDPSDARAPI
jgi:8-oxo-dGTP pyrophosphatase MutT (NUDIX family)